MSLLLDNYEKLRPYIKKETSSYIQIRCPVCNSDSPGIKIAKGKGIRGAYRCYSNHCDAAQIRKELGIQEEKNYYLSPYKPQLQKSVYSKSINLDKIQPRTELINPKLIECDGFTPIISETRRFVNGEKKVTIYPYSNTQRVYRLDCVPKDSGRKQIYLQSLNTEGIWEPGIGSKLWQVYSRGLEPFLSNPQQGQNTVLFVEGESTAEYVKEKGVAALTIASPFYTPERVEKLLYVLFTTYKAIENVIVVPDEDEPGYHKANLIVKMCHYLKKNAVVQTLSTTLGLEYVPAKGSDLADFVFQKENLILIN